MTDTPTLQKIAEDTRDISNISFSSGPDSLGYEVGVRGVSKIIAYWDHGPMAPIPYYAVFIGDFIVARVPAHMVFCSYQPPGTMQ